MIKLMKHYATDGINKARCQYSRGLIYPGGFHLGGEGKDCVTVYAKDLDQSLSKVFGDEAAPIIDGMTDYFEKGKVRIFPDNPLWAEACERAKH